MSLARVQVLASQLAQRVNGEGEDDDNNPDEEDQDPEEDEDNEQDQHEDNPEDADQEQEEDEDEEENDEEPDLFDDEGPKTIEEFWEDPGHQYDHDYVVHESFHTLYVSTNNHIVLMRLKRSEMRRLFYVQLTYESCEGLFPSMFDITPKNVGLCFLPAQSKETTDSNNIMLVEAQQSLPSTDLVAGLYSSEFSGMQSGLIREFTPIVDDEEAGEVLIDVTYWLESFGIYADSARLAMHEQQRRQAEAESAGIPPARCCGGLHPGLHTKVYGAKTERTAADSSMPAFASPWLGCPSQKPAYTSNVVEDVTDAAPPMIVGTRIGGLGGRGRLLQFLSFPQNFVLKFRSQRGGLPLKVRPNNPFAPRGPAMPLGTRCVLDN